MERLTRYLIGSSNVNRFYKKESYPGFKECKMIKCCREEVFKVRMEDLVAEDKEVIVSVIENFIADAVGEIKDENIISIKIDETIDRFLKTIEETAKKLPGTKFAVSLPVRRPAKSWYTTELDRLTKYYGDGICKLSLDNVAWVQVPLEKEQIFETDRVHFTVESGTFFLENLMSRAQEFFDNTLIDINEVEMEEASETDRANEVVVVGEDGRLATAMEKIKNNEKEIANLKEDILKRRHNDSMVTARLREDQDADLNKAKEDRVIMVGLTNRTPMPIPREEKEKWLNDMVSPILDSIVPDSSKSIAFISMGGNRERDIPLCEIKLKSKDLALLIRKEFAKKKKGGVDFGRLGIFNSVTLATRVRIEIMWAMAKKPGNDNEIRTVLSYSSRPILQIKDKEGKKRPMSLGFADAISRFGKGLREGDLAGAYRKAGTAFGGQMQQTFVVLHDKNASKPGPYGGKGSGGNSQPLTGKKRMRDPADVNNDGKKKGPGGSNAAKK